MHELDRDAELASLLVETCSEPRSEHHAHWAKSLAGDFEEMMRALVDDALTDRKPLNTLFERAHVPLHEVREVGEMRRQVVETLRVADGPKAGQHVRRGVAANGCDQRHGEPSMRLPGFIIRLLPRFEDRRD